MPDDSGLDDTPKAGSGSGGGGAPSATAGTSALPQAGTAVSSAGTSSKAGSGGGGTNTGTAGSSQAGSAGAGGGSTGGTSAGTGGTKPVSTNLPFTEDFEDGVADGFIPWNDKATAGVWEVVTDGAGKIYQPKAALSDLEFAVGGSTTWTDVAMTVKVRLNSADTDGQVVLRFKEPKTYLVLEIAEGKYKLRGRAAGSTTDLIAPSPKPVITAGTWYTVGITAKGTAVTLTLDGKQIGAEAQCAAAISNGGVALGADSGSVSFDDLKITAAP
ncbi:MAG TPA: family 16 glycoside hydrolase [Polyangiaceae bacterium]|nr:family 16 glycoside hydrolase [Polyangiaceae bacterium]